MVKCFHWEGKGAQRICTVSFSVFDCSVKNVRDRSFISRTVNAVLLAKLYAHLMADRTTFNVLVVLIFKQIPSHSQTSSRILHSFAMQLEQPWRSLSMTEHHDVFSKEANEKVQKQFEIGDSNILTFILVSWRNERAPGIPEPGIWIQLVICRLIVKFRVKEEPLENVCYLGFFRGLSWVCTSNVPLNLWWFLRLQNAVVSSFGALKCDICEHVVY